MPSIKNNQGPTTSTTTTMTTTTTTTTTSTTTTTTTTTTSTTESTTTTTESTTTTTTLVCGGFPPDTLPDGSYQLTYVNCGVSGSLLSCRCADQFQSLTDCQNNPLSCNATSLDLANCPFGPDITNLDGVLTCTACTP